MTSDLAYLGIAELGPRLAARALSPVELCRALLDRCARLEPRLNAFITLAPERILAEAKAVEAELAAGRVRGALHGVPVAVKDLCWTRGERTTGGSRILTDFVPNEDAEVVARWSAQDYHPVDELPYVGPLLPGSERVLVATGYAKWGMTNAVAAAHVLTGLLDHAPPDWAQAYRSWPEHPTRGLGAGVRLNAGVAGTMARDYARSAVSRRARSRCPAGSAPTASAMSARACSEAISRALTPGSSTANGCGASSSR